ncbi:hypothetical protein PAI11_37480 [Patulibacter medicamentivorans]|uniref:Scaffolding protein n=1 Tax=Patulibacter medicamentivorans TaxID=1097667 RepID=H0EA74_9ACTN|nr:hypothetical protein [Patulibacter medicamentivorans]EHN09414.1 hypothetical protein PAI11_37480 [Patulibacter medicamentivorans]
MAPTATTNALVHELAAIERATWPARITALHHTGVPLNTEPPAPPTPAPTPAAPAPAPPTPDPAAAPAPAPDPAAPGGPESFSREYVEGLRRENAGYRTAARDAETRLQEIADKDKTDAERATSRAEAAEARAGQLLRQNVAHRHGLPDEIADRLQGTTEEELIADAQKLAALGIGQPPAAPAPPTPAPAVPGGPQGPAGGSGAMTHDEARRLAETNPAEFNRKYEAGEIPASALAGK